MHVESVFRHNFLSHHWTVRRKQTAARLLHRSDVRVAGRLFQLTPHTQKNTAREVEFPVDDGRGSLLSPFCMRRPRFVEAPPSSSGISAKKRSERVGCDDALPRNDDVLGGLRVKDVVFSWIGNTCDPVLILPSFSFRPFFFFYVFVSSRGVSALKRVTSRRCLRLPHSEKEIFTILAPMTAGSRKTRNSNEI